MQGKRLLQLLIIALLLNGCSLVPLEMTEHEKALFADAQVPKVAASTYKNALRFQGTKINVPDTKVTKMQVAEIDVSVASGELPYKLTDMVKAALGYAAGNKLVQLGNSPVHRINDWKGRNSPPPQLPAPDYIITGSIVEFDKGLEVRSREIDIDLLFGKGRGETDLGGGIDRSVSRSRIGLNLFLEHFASGMMIPGSQTNFYIDVYEVDKSNDVGVFIYGSGMNGRQRAKVMQGLHKAVELLVECSVANMLAALYDLPGSDLLIAQNEKTSPLVVSLFRRDNGRICATALSTNHSPSVSSVTYLWQPVDKDILIRSSAPTDAALTGIPVCLPAGYSGEGLWWLTIKDDEGKTLGQAKLPQQRRTE